MPFSSSPLLARHPALAALSAAHADLDAMRQQATSCEALQAAEGAVQQHTRSALLSLAQEVTENASRLMSLLPEARAVEEKRGQSLATLSCLSTVVLSGWNASQDLRRSDMVSHSLIPFLCFILSHPLSLSEERILSLQVACHSVLRTAQKEQLFLLKKPSPSDLLERAQEDQYQATHALSVLVTSFLSQEQESYALLAQRRVEEAALVLLSLSDPLVISDASASVSPPVDGSAPLSLIKPLKKLKKALIAFETVERTRKPKKTRKIRASCSLQEAAWEAMGALISNIDKRYPPGVIMAKGSYKACRVQRARVLLVKAMGLSKEDSVVLPVARVLIPLVQEEIAVMRRRGRGFAAYAGYRPLPSDEDYQALSLARIQVDAHQKTLEMINNLMMLSQPGLVCLHWTMMQLSTQEALKEAERALLSASQGLLRHLSDLMKERQALSPVSSSASLLSCLVRSEEKDEGSDSEEN